MRNPFYCCVGIGAEPFSGVVADARQNFEAARPIQPVSLTPAPPPSRRPSQRRTSQRLPRKILAANQIFNEDGEASVGPSTPTTANSSTFAVSEPSQVSVIVEETSVLLSQTPPVSPVKRRRATVVTRSPETKRKTSDEAVGGSPSKNFLCGPISPRAELERELERRKSLISG